jgi:serine/threonine-protein kinase
VVAVFDQGEDDGTVYLVMEYVPGHTLRDVIRAEAPMPPRARSGCSTRS